MPISVQGQNQFHMINVVRRMADANFVEATSWYEMLDIHLTWVRDYNI